MKLWPSRRGDASYTPPPERREEPRYLLTKPIFAIPIRPDGSPDETCCAEGLSIDLSGGGIQCDVVGTEQMPSPHLLVGVEAADTVLHFATMEIRHAEKGSRAMRIGARFVSGNADLIRPENLLPTFQPRTCRFELGLSPSAIAAWVELGIFRERLVDRILVCPQCRALPTFRYGCRACGSVRLEDQPLMHHFACAYVGYVREFERDGQLVCPKCLARNLVVGADYEHLHGPTRCLDCDWPEGELELLGKCVQCNFQFPLPQALRENLIGYDVHRLDPLALLASG